MGFPSSCSPSLSPDSVLTYYLLTFAHTVCLLSLHFSICKTRAFLTIGKSITRAMCNFQMQCLILLLLLELGGQQLWRDKDEMSGAQSCKNLRRQRQQQKSQKPGQLIFIQCFRTSLHPPTSRKTKYQDF